MKRDKNAPMAREGDKVKFFYKGPRTGVVIRIRSRENRKAKRFLDMHGISDPYLAATMIAHIAVAGFGIVHTSGISELVVVGKATPKEWQAARMQESGIKVAKLDRQAEGREKADEGGLYDLKRGDKIMVEYRGGYKKEHVFLGLSSSGRVKFQGDFGREAWSHPQFVTKA